MIGLSQAISLGLSSNPVSGSGWIVPTVNPVAFGVINPGLTITDPANITADDTTGASSDVGPMWELSVAAGEVWEIDFFCNVFGAASNASLRLCNSTLSAIQRSNIETISDGQNTIQLTNNGTPSGALYIRLFSATGVEVSNLRWRKIS